MCPTRSIITLIPCLCFSLAVCSVNTVQAHPPSARAKVLEEFGKIPLHFEANHGQAGFQHAFLARGSGYCLMISPTEARFVFSRQTEPSARDLRSAKHATGEPTDRLSASVRLLLEGANPDACIEGQGMRASKVNYLIGNDRPSHRTGIPTFEKVRIEGVYPGVDLVHYGNQRRLEFDFLVAPETDPNVICFRIEGAESVRLDDDGDLVLSVRGGEVELREPVAYQVRDGVRSPVFAQYALEKGNLVRFEIGAYDPGRELVIDPIFEYSTFLGAGGMERGLSIAVDDTGVYVVGRTDSNNFPTSDDGADRTHNGGTDAFVTKFNLAGTDILYSTFLGGGDEDIAFAVAVDGTGHAYVGGGTRSGSFPTTQDAFDTNKSGGQDGFVTKLNPDGSDLVYSTFLGGSDDDVVFGLVLDNQERALVTGQTLSGNFPTTQDGFDESHGGMSDAFLARVSMDGSELNYSTFLGAGDEDVGTGIAIGPNQEAYVCGFTSSGNFPTTQGAFNRSLDGVADAFIARFLEDGSDLVYATFLGGDFDERALGIAVNAAGEAFVTGYTDSSDFPNTSPAIDRSYSKFLDAFLSRLSADGSSLLYSTFLGSTGDDVGFAVALWEPATVYVTGETGSKGFPTTKGSPGKAIHKGFDAFVSKIDTDASALLYSTYLGESGDDFAFDIAVDMLGNAYVTGETSSSSLDAIKDGFDDSPGGPTDAFVTMVAEFFGPGHDLAVTDISAPSKAKLSAKKPTSKGTVKVRIQNRSQHDEFIDDLGMAQNLVTLTVDSLGACPDLAPVFQSIDVDLPAQISPEQEITLQYEVTFDCVNDPLKAAKGDPTHADFRYFATVHHTALDGELDDHPADDNCPRDPLGIDSFPDGTIDDKGCGGTKPDKTLGADVLTDIQSK